MAQNRGSVKVYSRAEWLHLDSRDKTVETWTFSHIKDASEHLRVGYSPPEFGPALVVEERTGSAVLQSLLQFQFKGGKFPQCLIHSRVARAFIKHPSAWMAFRVFKVLVPLGQCLGLQRSPHSFSDFSFAVGWRTGCW